jgi:hypothetical protein
MEGHRIFRFRNPDPRSGDRQVASSSRMDKVPIEKWRVIEAAYARNKAVTGEEGNLVPIYSESEARRLKR